MMRSLAGSLLQVGTGAWPVERIGDVLAARDRAQAAAPAPACGLCLMSVEYRRVRERAEYSELQGSNKRENL